jgi:hypothetical protein
MYGRAPAVREKRPVTAVTAPASARPGWLSSSAPPVVPSSLPSPSPSSLPLSTLSAPSSSSSHTTAPDFDFSADDAWILEAIEKGEI